MRPRPEDSPWLIVALFAVVLAVLLAAKLARADEAAPPASRPALGDPVGLDAGEAAPFPGVLLPESRVLDYLDSKTRLEECSVRLGVRDRELARLLAAPPAPTSAAIKLSFWPGVAVGLVVGIGVLYGASVLLSLAP